MKEFSHLVFRYCLRQKTQFAIIAAQYLSHGTLIQSHSIKSATQVILLCEYDIK
jgi:hypothetical protein